MDLHFLACQIRPVYHWQSKRRYCGTTSTEAYLLDRALNSVPNVDTTNEDELAVVRSSPLWQAASKLDWADTQFRFALDFFNEYASNQVGIREERDDRSHRFVLFADKIPIELPTLIGSGIHALRSTLDTATSLLIEGVTKKQLDRVNFPFHETERELRDSFEPHKSRCGNCSYEQDRKPRQRHIIEHLPEFRDLLFGEFKPWKDGNYNLWALNKLDNIQKHRMLLLISAVTAGTMDYLIAEGVRAQSNVWKIGPGNEVVIAESRELVVPTGRPQIGVDLMFPSNIPFGDRPVFDTVGSLYREVRRILLILFDRFQHHEALSDC